MTGDLRQLYHATRYVVTEGAAEIAVRIGEPSPLLDAMLGRRSVETGAFITAWNPGSRPLDPAANDAAAARLASLVVALGIDSLPQQGIPDEPGWAPEDGLFILGLGRDTALAIAEAFSQNAFVLVRRGEPAELVFTRLMPEAG
jgi:hypothetical protein